MIHNDVLITGLSHVKNSRAGKQGMKKILADIIRSETMEL